MTRTLASAAVSSAACITSSAPLRIDLPASNGQQMTHDRISRLRSWVYIRSLSKRAVIMDYESWTDILVHGAQECVNALE